MLFFYTVLLFHSSLSPSFHLKTLFSFFWTFVNLNTFRDLDVWIHTVLETIWVWIDWLYLGLHLMSEIRTKIFAISSNLCQLCLFFLRINLLFFGPLMNRILLLSFLFCLLHLALFWQCVFLFTLRFRIFWWRWRLFGNSWWYFDEGNWILWLGLHVRRNLYRQNLKQII
jgi:hypothetical protein